MNMNFQPSRVQTSSLLCKNECGFYGNPSWDGYCSVCYREAYLKQNTVRQSPATITNLSNQAFSKFEAKRKQISGRGSNTIKNIFKFSRDDSRDKIATLPEECRQATDEFNAFLETLRASVSADISRQVSKLLENLETMGGSHINQYSMAIQNFYQSVSERISTSHMYASLSPQIKESLLNKIERFLTTWIYCWAFASQITDDETIDLKLQEKIRSLHWVTPYLLDSPINPNCPEEMTHLETATFALIRMNALFTSEDKLSQIVQCCRSVFDALKVHYRNCAVKARCFCHELNTGNHNNSNVSNGKNDCETIDLDFESKIANADDFLPTLIWIVLTANPPLICSNIRFIMRFANQNHLNSGETGYFFTNLSCAVHFLENLTHESLNLSEEEFCRCMRSGLPLVRRSDDVCEGEKLFTENGIRLLDLEDKLNNLNTKLESSEREMKDFHDFCQQEIKEMRKNWPLNTKVDDLDPRQVENPHVLLLGPPKTPIDTHCSVSSILDSDLGVCQNIALPDPIQPIPCKDIPKKST